MKIVEKFRYSLVSFLKSFRINAKARISLSNIVMLALGLTVAGALLPDAIESFTNSSLWSNTPSSVQTIAPVVGLVAIVAILIMLIKRR